MAGVWQWIQPWVWTMLVMPAPVPPMGNLLLPPSNLRLFRSFFRGSTLSLAVHHEFDIVSGGEAHIAVTVFVGDVTDLPDHGPRS